MYFAAVLYAIHTLHSTQSAEIPVSSNRVLLIFQNVFCTSSHIIGEVLKVHQCTHNSPNQLI